MTDLRKSLLFTLSVKQIDELQFDRDLEKEKVKIHYIIDPYDIINYCFPFGFDDVNNYSNTHLIADRQVALHYLIQSSDFSKILLNAYHDELIDLKDNKIVPYYKKYKTYSGEKFERLIAKERKGNNLIRNNLSLLTSIAIGAAESDISRFSSIFEKSLIEPEDSSLIGHLDYSEDPKFVSLYKEYFDSYIDLINQRPEAYYIQIFKKRYGHLSLDAIRDINYFIFCDQVRNNDIKNAKRDSYALALTVYLNLKLSNENNLFLLISSATNNKKVLDSKKHLWPVLKNRGYNIIRTAPQIFAKFIFGDLTKSSGSGISITYKELKKLIDEQSFSKNVNNDALWEKIESERNAFENYGILLKFDSFKIDLEKAINSKVVNEGVAHSMQSVLDDINNIENPIENAFRKMKETFIGVSLFQNLKTLLSLPINKFESRNYGNDPIESINQQLPITFFLEGFEKKISIVLRQTLSEISYFYRQKVINRQHLLDFRESISKILPSLESDSSSQSLIKFLILLIYPIPNKGFRRYPNKYVFEQINELIQLSKPNQFDHILRELKYIQVWAARRAKNYKKGLDRCIIYISEYPNDPRFYHGYALILYCIEFESFVKDRKSKIKNIEKVIMLSEKAIALYKSEFEDIIESKYSLEALYNTLAVTYSFKAFYNLCYEDPSEISTRHLLLKAKENIDELHLTEGWKGNLAEYLATESLYYLSYSLYSKRFNADHNNTFSLIQKAEKSIDDAINKAKEHNKKISQVYNDIKLRIELELKSMNPD